MHENGQGGFVVTALELVFSCQFLLSCSPGVLASEGWEAWQPSPRLPGAFSGQRQSGKTSGELGVSKFVECDIFFLRCLTLLVGQHEGHLACKNSSVCWWWRFDWNFAHLIAPVVTTTSIILSSNKTGFTLENVLICLSCFYAVFQSTIAFSALTLLVRQKEVHLACKTLSIGMLVVVIWLELCTAWSCRVFTIQAGP